MDAFRKEAANRGLKKEVMNTVIENDFYTEGAISLIKSEDISEMKLKLGMRRVLENWQKDLLTKQTSSHKDKVHKMGSFEEKSIAYGLTQETIYTLTENDFYTEGAIALIKSEDISEMKLKLGMKRVLENWQEDLLTKQTSSHKDNVHKMGSFEEKAIAYGLTQETIDTLTENGFQTEEAISAMKSEDISELELKLGARRVIEKWQNLILVYGQASPEEACGEHPHVNEEISEAPEPVDLETAMKGLNMKKEKVEAMREHVEEHGVDNLLKKIDDQLILYKSCKVNIAITGLSGSGKSTLINTLRNLPAYDNNAAKVGTNETTMKVTPYSFPKLPNVTIWDLPGVGTPKFAQNSYLEKVFFEDYDAFIIVVTTRFFNEDLWLANEAHKQKKPFYFLRSKIDFDIQNHKRDFPRDPVKEMLPAVKHNLKTELGKHDLPNSKVYLLSGRLENKARWEFPEFLKDLYTQTPQKNQDALLKAMLANSKEILEKKRQNLEERLNNVVIAAILDNNNYQKVLQTEMTLYTESLGITKEDLRDIDTKKLDEDLQKIIEDLNDLLKPISWWGKVVNFFNKWIPQRNENIRKSNATNAKSILESALSKSVELANGVLEQRMQLD